MREIEFSHLHLNNHVLSAIKEHFSKNVCLCDQESQDIESRIQKWFASTPKVSTVRVNALKYSNLEVIQLLKTEIVQNNPNCIPDIKEHDTIPNCLLIGPNGVNFYHGEAEIIIDSTCGCAVLRGANIFAPGVLCMPSSVQSGTVVDILVDINRKCKRGSKYFNGSKIYIGSGMSLFKRDELFKNNAKVNGIAVNVLSRISGVPTFTVPHNAGILQNLPSICCSLMLDPNENHNVLDMCASPGNKTTHIATLMKNKGCLIAIDKTSNKIEKIIDTCKNFGITNVSCFTFDSTQIFDENKCEENYIPPFGLETFDRILLDGPCSALGQRPRFDINLSLKQLESHPNVQKQLFSNAVPLLRRGGYLVYSTCTITTEENEKLVAWALNKFKNLQLCKTEPYIGSPGLPNCGLSEEQQKYVQRFGIQQNDTIGFFIAKFTKI